MLTLSARVAALLVAVMLSACGPEGEDEIDAPPDADAVCFLERAPGAPIPPGCVSVPVPVGPVPADR